MISRFTEKAQEALQRAQQIMFTKHQTMLDVEHIFLALLQQRNSLPAQIVTGLGGDAQHMMEQLDSVLDNMESFSTNPRQSATGYITLRANRVLQGAAEEADSLSDEFISTEHLFLAIASAPDGQTGRILSDANVDHEHVVQALKAIGGDRKPEAPGELRWSSSGRRHGGGKGVITPSSLVKPVGFSHGVSAVGRMVFLAGQIAVDGEGNLVAPGDVVGQYRQVLRNLQAVMDESGGQMADIVKLTMYVKDRDDYKAHLKELGRVHKDFFGSYYPATALVEISRFFEEGVLIEIEGIAVLG